MLQLLAAIGRPATLTELSEASSLHENTLRGHLAALAGAGLVRRERAEPQGRGRPALLWTIVPAGTAGAAEYAGLATVLARALHRSSRRPAEDAIEAGRAWGHDLATRSDATDAAPTDQVHHVLEELGFAPEGDERDASGATVRLTRCPLLDVARELPEVVCNVHLGLIGGILEAADGNGVESVDSRLVPFAEPGACLLELRTAGR